MKLTETEIQQRLQSLAGWTLSDGKLVKKFRFKRFAQSIDFVSRVARAAEEQDHHPDFFISFNQVTLYYMTHRYKGITDRDFQGAATADALAAQI